MVVPLIVMSPPSAKPVLVVSLDFGLIGLEHLYKLESQLSSLTLCLKCFLLIRQGRDQVHGALLVGKHQQNQNFIYSSLSLGTLNKMKLMLCTLFIYNMGDKIRRMSMNVAF